jgi:hypothetical protein
MVRVVVASWSAMSEGLAAFGEAAHDLGLLGGVSSGEADAVAGAEPHRAAHATTRQQIRQIPAKSGPAPHHTPSQWHHVTREYSSAPPITFNTSHLDHT